MIAHLLVRALDHVDPMERRLWAARIFIGTIAGAVLTAIVLVLLGQSTFFTQMMSAVSWLAITIGALDVLCTTDVRASENG